MRVVFPAEHAVILTFDGCSKNNPKGPSGYGFVLHRGTNDTNECSMGDLLLQGYGYSPSGGSSNRMEYAGLVEGLHWAKLVHTTKIIVRGDSNLVIKQITGEYQVKIQCCNGIARISSNLSRTQINLAKRLYFNTFVVRTTRLQIL